MKLLENKVALITGGSRGIGEGIVLKFAEQGANIAFTYVSSDERANALVEKVKALGVKCVCYKSDAGDYAASEILVADIIKEYNSFAFIILLNIFAIYIILYKIKFIFTFSISYN